MDLTVDQSALSRALRLITRVAPTKSTLPILQMVLLEADSGRLKLTATDGEIGAIAELPASIEEDGRTAVLAGLLGDYVAQLSADPVRLRLDPERHRVKASSGKTVAQLAAADPQDFPNLPTFDEEAVVELDAGRLRLAIERVAFAAAREESRPVLAGVLFDFGAEALTLAAADGFRLARAQLAQGTPTAQQLLVPARAVSEFGRLLGDVEAARLAPTADGRGLYLIARQTTIFSRLIEGSFPDIERVIPRDWQTRVTVNTPALRQAVRVATLFGGGDARPVVLRAADGRLQLQASGDETGEAESELPAKVDGELQAVALNTRLLLEVLDAVRDPELDLCWTSATSPVLLREHSHPDTGDLWVVMPLHDARLVRREAA